MVHHTRHARGLFGLAAVGLALGLATAAATDTAGSKSKASKEGGVVTDDYRTAKELGLMEGFPPPEDKQVTRWNALLFAPYNRYSYLHMRTFYPSEDVAPAKNPIPIERELDSAIDRITVVKPDKESGEPTDEKVGWDTFLKETFTDAIVVVSGDHIVYEAYLNGMSPDQPHQMMSVTKSFTGLFAAVAIADGKIKEKQLVGTLIPELAKSGAFADATLRQVLDMTNSMDFDEDYADPNSGIRQYGVVVGLMKPEPDKTYASSIYEYLPTLGRDPAYKHGEIFHYQTPKTDVVNWVTNRATGKSFEDSLVELWEGIGADGETYVLLDSNATLFAGGGLNASPENLARFGRMMINDGKVRGKQVVSADIVKALQKGGSTEAFKKGPNATGPKGGGDWSYRAQWWVRHTKGHEAFMAEGIHGQWIYIDPTRDIAVIKQSSQPESAGDYWTAYDLAGIDAVIEHVTKSREKASL